MHKQDKKARSSSTSSGSFIDHLFIHKFFIEHQLYALEEQNGGPYG